MTDAEEKDPAPPKGQPRLVVELKELDEIYQRFRKVFMLSNLLTIVLAGYVIIRLMYPEKFEMAIYKQMQTIGLCGLLGSSILLCVVQWLCLRQTTLTSRRKIEHLTFIDALTNVYNYRYLDRRLDEEIRLCKRFKTSLSVVYLDMDGFKRVNDDFGHQVGNAVLAEIGSLLKVGARATDLVGRMGGDEFLVILPGTSRDEAQIVSERILQRLEGHAYQVEEKRIEGIRASVGVASFPYDCADKASLIAAADQAMYRAKQSGGNRVCI